MLLPAPRLFFSVAADENIYSGSRAAFGGPAWGLDLGGVGLYRSPVQRGKKDGRMGRWCVAERENGPQQIWKVALTHTTYPSKLHALISAGDEPATLSSERSTKEYPFCRRLGQLHRLLQDQKRKGESPFALKKLRSLFSQYRPSDLAKKGRKRYVFLWRSLFPFPSIRSFGH